ncbi:hypothetical protein BDV59DRAFT_198968 [Aspergillus ambiguus]|uniref:uncharacterized protein n=1 Tax=Aspergillus ambiguus TaxID=176160 RepID=UPI003CCE358D
MTKFAKNVSAGLPASYWNHHVAVNKVTSNTQSTLVEFWQNALAGAECSSYPTLPRCVDHPEIDGETEYQFHLPSDLLEAISTSTLVRAAWALITSCMAGSNDVVFGAEASQGNTIIPVRVKLDGYRKVREYLKEAQRQATEAVPYEQMGLDQIAKASSDCEKACTFQTVLVHSQGHSTLELCSKYGLIIQTQFAEGHINLKASFDSRVIEPMLVFKLLRRLEFVMQQLNNANVEKALNELEILPPLELDQIREWNSSVPPVVEKCIHDIIQERVEADPEAQAVCAWDGKLSYRELDDLSSCVASHLVNLGVGPEKVIPLCFEKSMWTVVAMLSVLKASGTFVLLDPSLPDGRLQIITQKVQAETAITSDRCQARLSPFVRQTVVLSEETMGPLKSQSQRLRSQMPKALPSNSAYAIFTSGSTGEPKGCVVEHRSYCSAAIGHGKILGMGKDIRTLQFGSYNFAGAIMEIVMTLLYGGCICIPSDEDRSVNLAAVIGKLNANWAFLTSTVLALLQPEDVPSLRTICVGGEPIRSSQIREWAPKIQLRQTYGSAETAAVVSSAGLEQSSVVTSVGKATTCRCWLTSPTNPNQLVPIGAPGEVVFEGPVIGRHYIGNPTKTAEAFINAPAWRAALGPIAASSRFYRTGDLASYKSDGSIELLGRKDTQIKLHGQRIELGEIEHQARQSCPNLKEVAVELATPDGSGPKLICFLVLKSGQVYTDGAILDGRVRSAIENVKDRLQRVLPHYMVPSVFLPLQGLPLTASGKTDRRVLRQIGSALTAQQILDLQPKPEGRKRQPTTQAERQLQKIWSDVLQIDSASIGLDDSFLQIGGDSYSAMKVVNEAQIRGMNLKLPDIFHQNSLVELAQMHSLHAEEEPKQPDQVVLIEPAVKLSLLKELESKFGINPAYVADIYPATDVQEYLVEWGPIADFGYLDLDSSLDTSDLENCCIRVLKKFPILRAQFLQLQGKCWHVIQQRLSGFFSVHNVIGDLNEYTLNFCRQNAQSLRGTQPRAAFILLKHDEGLRLLIRVSHAQYDAVCLRFLLESIFDDDYAEMPVQPTFSTFLSYAAHRRPQSQAYWSKLLQGAHITQISPYVRPSIPPTTVPEFLKVITKAHLPRRIDNITHATLVRTAWAVLLSCMTGEPDVTFAYHVAGRNSAIPGIERIVGCCLNDCIGRVDFSSIKSVQELVHGVQEQYLSVGDADSLGLREVIRSCTEWPPDSLFDTYIQHRDFLRDFSISTPWGTVPLGKVPVPYIIPYNLMESTSEGENILFCLWSNTHRISHEAASTILDNLARITERLVTGMHMALPEWMNEVESVIQ